MDDDTTGDNIGLNCIQTTSIHLSVVRCALSQPKEKDNWRRTTMFHIIMKIGGRNCKIIVDSGSYINAVSSTVIGKIGLKAEPHPHPYRVTWINSSALEVKQRCLVPIDFGLYKDKFGAMLYLWMRVMLSLDDHDYTTRMLPFTVGRICINSNTKERRSSCYLVSLRLNHLNQSLSQ